QMVETAPGRTARTRHRLRQGPRCHTAGNTAGPACSWHQPPAAAARAEATPSSFAPCREVRTALPRSMAVRSYRLIWLALSYCRAAILASWGRWLRVEVIPPQPGKRLPLAHPSLEIVE